MYAFLRIEISIHPERVTSFGNFFSKSSAYFNWQAFKPTFAQLVTLCKRSLRLYIILPETRDVSKNAYTYTGCTRLYRRFYYFPAHKNG